jgi:hypothetical protein
VTYTWHGDARPEMTAAMVASSGPRRWCQVADALKTGITSHAGRFPS